MISSVTGANPQDTGAAIVTTLRDAGPSLDAFVAYHLAIGFSHLFLFFDDPADPDLPRLAAHPAVTAIAHDANLRRAWEMLPHYEALRDFVDTEVQARQMLNVELAMTLARLRGLAWLLHIDVDELFFSPNGSVSDHFDAATQRGADVVKYWNHEAVPEKTDVADPFREVDLFKLSPALISQPDEACRALLQATPQIQQRYHFLFYSNGKSAVRLATPGLRPRGVHDFYNPDSPPQQLQSSTHAILHYACASFDVFWRKYRQLGSFPDQWFGRQDIRAVIGPFHLEARDVVARGNREQALEFYRRRVAIEDRMQSEALIRHGILARLPLPGRILASLAP